MTTVTFEPLHYLLNFRVFYIQLITDISPCFYITVQYVCLDVGRRTQAGDATNRAIAQWRRRLDCVVQQQRGYIEHLIWELQDVTVTLDNNWDKKHVVSCC